MDETEEMEVDTIEKELPGSSDSSTEMIEAPKESPVPGNSSIEKVEASQELLGSSSSSNEKVVASKEAPGLGNSSNEKVEASKESPPDTSIPSAENIEASKESPSPSNFSTEKVENWKESPGPSNSSNEKVEASKESPGPSNSSNEKVESSKGSPGPSISPTEKVEASKESPGPSNSNSSTEKVEASNETPGSSNSSTEKLLNLDSDNSSINKILNPDSSHSLSNKILSPDPNFDTAMNSNAPTLGCCANCSINFENEESKMDFVHSQEDGDIPIQTALGYIFEMRMEDNTPQGESVFHTKSSDRDSYSFCEQCSTSLSSLYEALQNFRMLCAMESLVFEQLKFISKIIQKKIKGKIRKNEYIEQMDGDFPLKVKLEVEDSEEGEMDREEDNFIDDSYGYAHDPGQISDYEDSENSIDTSIPEDGIKKVLPVRKSAQNFHSNLRKLIEEDEGSSEESTYFDDHDFDPNSEEDEMEDEDEIHPKMEDESFYDTENSDREEKYVPPAVPRKKVKSKSIPKAKKTPVKIKKEESGLFTCSQCPKSFVTPVSLKRHERTHDPEVLAKLTCDVCTKVFSRREHLARHKAMIHGEEREKKASQGVSVVNYQCPVCSVHVESTYSAFEAHVLTHGVENPFPCPHCPEHFPSLQNLKTHINKTHKKKRARSVCQVCNAEFSKSFYLSRHQRDKHRVPNNMSIESLEIFDLLQPDGTKSDGTNTCGICFKTYARKDKLTKHMLNHTAEAPFTCDICGKKFFSERGLENHKMVHSDDNPNKCGVCNKVLSRPDHLKSHMATHDKEPKAKPERVFCCEVCGKEFKNNDNLKMHRYCHTNERPWSCETCGKAFNHPSSLALHMKIHSDERPFCCSVCGRTFKLGHHLRDHELTHWDNAPRPFTCETCGKAFKKLKHVKSHMKVHEGTKDHVCDECGKAFSQIYNLRAHFRAVHLNDPAAKRKKKTTIKKESTFHPPLAGLPLLPQLPPLPQLQPPPQQLQPPPQLPQQLAPSTIQVNPNYQQANQAGGDIVHQILPPHPLFPYRPHSSMDY